MLATLVYFAAVSSGHLTAPNPAEALLQKVEAKARSLDGFSTDVTALRLYTSAKPGAAPYRGETKLHVDFKQPNLFVIQAGDEGQTYRQISDGTNLFFVGKEAYTKDVIDPKAAEFHWFHDDLLHLLVQGDFSAAVEAPRPPVLKMLPNEVLADGTLCRVIEAKVGGGYPIDYKLYVGDDLIVRRIVNKAENNGRPLIIDTTISGFQANPPQAADLFAYTPAEGLKESSRDFPLQPGEFPLVKVGGEATDFSLPTPAGGKLSLRESMKGSRAMLLNFWFVHCPPCRAEHPHLQKLYKELKPKGLAMIAVDDQDTAKESATYLKRAGLTFPVVLTGPRFRTDPKTGETDYQGPMMPDYASLAPYGIRECPTNILIDTKTGKVVYVASGWDEAGLRKALADLGVS